MSAVKTHERCVLVTGFEPFGGEFINASEQAVQLLAGWAAPGGVRVETAILPCVFGVAGRELLARVKRLRPEVIVCVGEAGGRAEISLERVAINLDDARLPDNAGAQPVDLPVMPGAPAAYWSTLPLRATLGALREAGLPARLSETAGTFVCNHVFYTLLHALRRQAGVKAGFVHLPWLPVQAIRHGSGPTGLAVEKAVRALQIVITQALKRPDGLTLPA